MLPGFEDREVTLDHPELLTGLAAALSSRTRIQVLRALVSSADPLHINEVARRVGVDPSPARGHLEALVKAGLAREVSEAVGRERRFATTLRTVRIVLEGVERATAPEKAGPAPKAAQRIEKKLSDLAKDRAKLDERARRLRDELREAWGEAAEPKAR